MCQFSQAYRVDLCHLAIDIALRTPDACHKLTTRRLQLQKDLGYLASFRNEGGPEASGGVK